MTIQAIAAEIARLRELRAKGPLPTVEQRLDFIEGAFAAFIDALAEGSLAAELGPSLEIQHRDFVGRIRAAEGSRFGG